jgi:hypothetical protein
VVPLGYSLSSEEHGPLELVEQVRAAEHAGCDRVCIHQVGPDAAPFLDLCARELFPAAARAA